MVKRALHKLRVPPALAALVGGLHPKIKRKLRAALEAVLEDPRCGKALKEELSGLWSLRVGRHRVIYRIGADRRIELVAFGARDAIYEQTLRLVSRESGSENR